MDFEYYFPIRDQLAPAQQERILTAAERRTEKSGTVFHNGSMVRLGLLLIRGGQLRVYSLSREGREVTLYHLFEMDIGLFSASCILPNIQHYISENHPRKNHRSHGHLSEVVTRMLRYFRSEGLIKLTRGTVEIMEPKALKALRNE